MTISDENWSQLHIQRCCTQLLGRSVVKEEINKAWLIQH